MMSYRAKLVVGLLGTALMVIFVVGLAHSISTGFAGVIGGLPFTLIVMAVLAMALYDFWDECLRRK